MAATLDPVAPEEAIAALKARGKELAPSFSHLDVWNEEHSKAFTVAKSAGFDILKDLHGSLAAAMANGEPLKSWAKRIRPALEEKGWWGRKDVVDPDTGEVVNAQLGSTRRLQVIFDANMRVSYAAGHWAQFERTKARRPILRYVAVRDGVTRPEHAARHGMCAAVDDPVWDYWGTPCGYGCRCTLQSLTQRDYDRLDDDEKKRPPPEEWREFINRRTGEVTRLPKGIDPGWGYNPGKAGARAASAAAEKLIDAAPAMSAAMASDPRLVQALAEEFKAWAAAVTNRDPVTRSSFVAGALSRDVLEGLAKAGITPSSGAIIVQQRALTHALRDAKASAGKTIPAGMLADIPRLLANPKAVIRDKRKSVLLYVFDVPGQERLGKLVIELDFSARVQRAEGGREQILANAFRTAGLVPASELANGKTYELLTGGL